MRAELLAVSIATIDRYLPGAKARDQIAGKSTTKPSPLLRSSIKIRKAIDEVEASPGFFEGDTVAHCGPTLEGEFARTLNLTDMHIGWVFTRTVRNNTNTHTHIPAALKAGLHEIPYRLTGLDFDNGTEFLDKAVSRWAAQMEIFFTRSRPYNNNEQATIESKTIISCASTGSTTAMTLPRSVRCSTRTIESIGYGSGRDGQRSRLLREPRTRLDGCWQPEFSRRPKNQSGLPTGARLNPAAIARQIADLQAVLLKLAKDKTEQLSSPQYPAPCPTPNGPGFAGILT